MVYVHLADGFEEIEALSIVDVLRRADIAVKTVSVKDDKIVRGAHDITVLADLLFEEADYGKCEMIVLPGGMAGATALAKHKGLTNQILLFARAGKWLAAICAAPMVLGQLSLLKGKKATSYPSVREQLVGAVYSEDKIVIDGKIITSRGPGTAMEFSLMLVEVLKNEQISNSLRKSMLV